MDPNFDDDDLAAFCCHQRFCSNGAEDSSSFIQRVQEKILSDFESSVANLQAQEEQICNTEVPCDSFRGENNDLGPDGGVFYNNSIGSSPLDLAAASFSGVLQQERHQFSSVRGVNNDSATHVQQEPQINSSASVVNLQQAHEEQVCNIEARFDSFRGENSNLGRYGGVFYNNSIGSAPLDLAAASFCGVLQQEPHQVSVRGVNNDSAIIVQQEPQQLCSGVVEINSSSSVGTVKQEQEEHLEEECSRKRRRNGSCSNPGTKACREKLRREKLNDRFMDLSSVLEPGRTPKTDKVAIIDDAIRVVNQLRGDTHELKETNQKLLEEIKSLKVEKNELREEKLVLKADKEKMEQQMKSMAVPSHPAAAPSPGFMPSHPAAAFHPNKMAVYPNYGYYPNMPMWAYMPPVDRNESDTSRLA